MIITWNVSRCNRKMKRSPVPPVSTPGQDDTSNDKGEDEQGEGDGHGVGSFSASRASVRILFAVILSA